MPPSKKSTTTHYDSGISNSRDYSSGRRSAGKLNAFDIFVKLPILLLVLGFMGFFIITGGTFDKEVAQRFFAKLPEFPSFLKEQQEQNKKNQEQYEATAVQESYYVKSIGRTCEWNDEYEAYYDKETDCYFWYNTTTKTHTWQYWYEGISSDYGDYGWMEWDAKEGEWIIEVSNGEWIYLPDKYDQSYLWHVE